MENRGCQDSFSSCLLSTHPTSLSAVLKNCPLPLTATINWTQILQVHRGIFRFPPTQAATWHIWCTCEIGSQGPGQAPTSPFLALLRLNFIIYLLSKQKIHILLYFTEEETSAIHLFSPAELGYSASTPTHAAEPSAWSAWELWGN